MDPKRKLRNRRGMTLVEVLTVVALMVILLGIAMPNLIAESQAIRLATMNGYARSVAVAVQSRLYGMKNAGSAKGSAFYSLNLDEVSTSVEVNTEEESKKNVRYVTNFGEKGAAGRQYLLSGALTDTELMQNGKIVVVYDPTTADILEVFYGEKEYLDESNANLFPTAVQSFLTRNEIGLYRGDPQPELVRNIGLPEFSIVWRYDDEMYLEMQMVGNPDPELLDKNLGFEVYAELPATAEGAPKEEVLIYAQGMFDADYTFQRQNKDGSLMFTDGDKSVPVMHTIGRDYGSLKLSDIVSNSFTEKIDGKDVQKSGILRFAFDSMVTAKANYGGVQSILRHQSNPWKITAASEALYPRESVSDWFNEEVNPYLHYWAMRDGITAEAGNAYDRIREGANVLQFVDVDQSLRLHVRLYVLSDETTVLTDSTGASAIVHEAADNYGRRDIYSININPYFFALANASDTVTLSSVRDLNNLKYLFEDVNPITKATLSGDIDGQQLYDKYIKVNNALKASGSSGWGFGSDHDSTGVDSVRFNHKKEFTLSGKKPDGSGSFKIKSLQLGGRTSSPGGLFEYARNCTFEDLDIVNPKIWRNGRDRGNFLLNDPSDPTQITGITQAYGSVPSGALVGIAVNCTFKNVRTYLDSKQALQTTNDGGATHGLFGLTNYRISGTVCGGLVGIAIGEKDHPTTFENCAASSLLNTEFYYNACDCIYAGGLVGIAMGNVSITNSYAASELTGYYAGGLVGAVASGDWKINDYDWASGTAEGKLTVTDSFAAGIIMPLVRVGGGLIASIPQKLKNNVSVSGCYSAAQWKILPPAAYGTFEGDKDNYYVYPAQIDTPVTANVLARFTCVGDVFSLRKGVSGGPNTSGIPCSAPMLKQQFSKWSPVTSTTAWSWAELVQNNPSDEYPFPMPAGNTEFWGEWLRSYDSASETAVPAFRQSFVGYYAAYHSVLGEYGRQYDAGLIQTNLAIILTADGKITVGGGTLNSDGATYAKDNSYYWAKDVIYNGTLLGQGIDSATKITPSATSGKIDFTSAKYYSKDYDPINGSTFLPEADGVADKSNYRSLPLLWDFYGFYFLANYSNWREENMKYYISYDAETTQKEGTATRGDTTYLNGDGFHNFKKIVVNEQEFKAAVGYGTKTLPAANATVAWDNTQGFHVE